MRDSPPSPGVQGRAVWRPRSSGLPGSCAIALDRLWWSPSASCSPLKHRQKRQLPSPQLAARDSHGDGRITEVINYLLFIYSKCTIRDPSVVHFIRCTLGSSHRCRGRRDIYTRPRGINILEAKVSKHVKNSPRKIGAHLDHSFYDQHQSSPAFP